MTARKRKAAMVAAEAIFCGVGFLCGYCGDHFYRWFVGLGETRRSYLSLLMTLILTVVGVIFNLLCPSKKSLCYEQGLLIVALFILALFLVCGAFYLLF